MYVLSIENLCSALQADQDHPAWLPLSHHMTHLINLRCLSAKYATSTSASFERLPSICLNVSCTKNHQTKLEQKDSQREVTYNYLQGFIGLSLWFQDDWN